MSKNNKNRQKAKSKDFWFSPRRESTIRQTAQKMEELKLRLSSQV